MGNEHSKPVTVVELLSDKSPIYKVPALKEMLKSGPAGKNTKVFVICISGVYRSGKSFLLNLLKVYLDYFCEHKSDDEWIKNGNIEIAGGNWAQGQRTVTHGILMYMYPRLINEKAIILMDCQGTKDLMKSSTTLDNQIMFLALQLSDVHILNLERSIGADDLNRLDLCIHHADDQTAKLFRRQIFLIRNWGNGERPEQLDSVIKDAQSDAMKATAIGIKNAFVSVDIESLPHPGKGVDGKSETSKVHLCDVDDKFLQDACVLFRRMIQQLSLDAKYTFLEFIGLFEHASSRAVEKISTPKEAYEESLIQGLCRELMETANVQIEQLETQVRTGQLSVEMVEKMVAKIFGEVNGKFTNHPRVARCKNQHILNDYTCLLQKSEEQLCTSMVNSCKIATLSRKMEDLEMSNREAAEKIKSLKGEFEKQMADIERERKADKKTYDALFEKLQRENSKRLEDMQEDHEQQLKGTVELGEAHAQGLREKHSKQMKRVRKDNDKRLQQLNLALKEIDKKFDDLKENLQTGFDEKVTKQKEAREQKEKEKKDKGCIIS